ncbi:MAG TPA: RDD family protein [Tepidisphaeraceae bacterium]|nr:RDD family protein [Tepidisphaeraceae bacterium]
MSLFVTGVARSAPATQPAGQDLLAHGSEDRLWAGYVHVPPYPKEATEQTRIAYRIATKDQWEFLTDIGARAVGLANRGTQLAVLLEGGEWVLVSDDGTSATGQPLPEGARLLALGNDPATLWAIGLLPASAATQPAAGKPAATQSVATQSPAAQSPASFPATTQAAASGEFRATSRLALFVLNEGNWERAPFPLLPPELSSAAPMSLAVIDHVPYVAALREDDTVQVLRPAGEAWQDAYAGPRIAAPAAAHAFKLLANTGAPVLWVAGQQRDWLYFLAPNAAPRGVEMLDVVAPPSMRAAAIAAYTIRELAVTSTTNAKLIQQDYDRATGKPTGNPVAINLPHPVTTPLFFGLTRLLLTVAVIIALWASMFRRQVTEEGAQRVTQLDLAPFSRRLAAGAIDALPFVVPLAVMGHLARLTDAAGGDPQPAPPGWDMALWVSLLAALVVYILHTALFETFTGRSIGKALTGLRVASLDGSTPEAPALLIRNFLRVIDVGLAGIPLMMVFTSPLRQRIGDMAGGTVVVRDRVRPEGVLDDETAAEELTKAQAQADASAPEPPPAPKPPEPAGRV